MAGSNLVSLAPQKADFTELWRCEFDAVDETNRRGQGWSEVGRIEFLTPTNLDYTVSAYLKRQQRYRARTLAHPINGISTLRREHQMMQWVAARGVMVARPLYFAEGSQQRALLVVEALQGYVALDQPVRDNRMSRTRLILAIAALVRKLHGLGVYHGCLYPKHIFWSATTGDIRLIDWEKARHVWRRNRATLRDLDSLNRRAQQWSLRERVIFLAAYLGVSAGDPLLKRWWQQLSDRYRIKSGR